VYLGDVIRIAQSGGPDAIFLLLLFVGMLLGGRIYVKREIDYRDQLIARQDERLSRQQDLFDQALAMVRDQLRTRPVS
jgi:hypothetical protein